MAVPSTLLALHAVYTGSMRLLSFAMPILLVGLKGRAAAFQVATLNMTASVVKLVALPFLGSIVDRVQLSTIGYVGAMGQVAAACACAALLSLSQWGGFALTVISLLTATAELCKEFTSIGLEMRVAVAMKGVDLRELNSLVKRTQLAAKFVAPLAFGVLASRAGKGTVLAVIAGSLLLLSAVGITQFWRQLLAHHLNDTKTQSKVEAEPGRPVGWSDVSPVAGMSLAFAMLFCTVLDDHNPNTTAFLLWQGMPTGILGLCRSAGALCGLLGTWLGPRLQQRLGLLPGAATALGLFVLVLAPIAPCLEAKASPYVLLVLVTLSRPFLWAFDLSMVSVVQELVPASRRGTWAGVQAFVCQLMESAISGLAVAWSANENFTKLAATSFATVFAASLLFAVCAFAHQRTKSLVVPVEHYRTA